MKKVLLFSGALLALTASMALAGSVNFSWNQCLADAGVANKTFTCASNSGTNVAIGTFTLDNDLTDFVGVEVVADVQVGTGASVPAWWDNVCRANVTSATFDFSVLLGGCSDPFGSPGQGGLAAYQISGNKIRLKAAGAIADPVGITAATEYYGVRFAITNAKTATASGCAGCTTPACLVLNSIKAAGLSGGQETSGSDNPASSPIITWQNGTGLNCLATPSQNRTWGQVKSLYR